MPGKWLSYTDWKRHQRRNIPHNRRIAVFDFSDSHIDGPQGRRFYCLFMFFIRAGYFPVIIDNYRFLATRHTRFKRLIEQQDFALHQTIDTLLKAEVLVTDKHHPIRRISQFEKVINIDFSAGYSVADKSIPFPFPMFPDIYASKQDQHLGEIRTIEKKWAVFFGGDTATKKYTKTAIKDIYKKIPRAEMLRILETGLPAHLWQPLRTDADLSHAQSAEQSAVLTLNTRDCSIEPRNWLKTVALSRFFLGCPGVRYPMSHNLIEAMAVGSVPITQYPELFFPALQPGINCLTFNCPESLVDTVLAALSMPDKQSESLSKAAIAYYDTYLEPKAVIKRLLASEGHTTTICLLPFLKRGGGFA